MSDRCGYSMTDLDGNEEPCDRPARGWRWYQDVGEHEDLLDVACDWHANEGGRRIREAEAQVARVEAWCDQQDARSKGESPTTAGVRAALRGWGQ